MGDTTDGYGGKIVCSTNIGRLDERVPKNYTDESRVNKQIVN